MKAILTSICLFVLTAVCVAQAPQAFNYSAVVRNGSGTPIPNQLVKFRLSILRGTVTGPSVYVETQTTTTDANGMVNLEIGRGTIVSGVFAAIPWNNDAFFFQVEVDPTGGTTYQLMGTTQFLSVPYALNAKYAENVTTETDPVFNLSIASGITTNDTAYWNRKQDHLINGAGISIVNNTISLTSTVQNIFYLGQDTLGGVVYFIYYGQDKKQHGLIVSKTETSAKWQNTAVLVNADRTDDGAYNTNLMTDSPAKDWIRSNFSNEWYLPAIDELSLLWQSRFIVNKTLRSLGQTLLSTQDFYWSSTEGIRFVGTSAFFYYFQQGYANGENGDKSSLIHKVRAIRSF